ncbi:hypothetical protein [Nocardia transvalensis]|uniref:hypothetical protein n=1 Tax=Nocardia transvalensis TaxID=37333 RepID=UPI001E5693BA|nr:hypothetical protein [Nocardia transvalensis]
MSWRFNPPPEWPVPDGFVPPDGWQPDPSWPPPPPDWQWWIPAGDEVVAVEDRAGATRKGGWRARRESRQQEKRYQQALAQAQQDYAAGLARWQAEQDLLDEMVCAATAAIWNQGGSAYGLLLKAKESALWAIDAMLIEPRRQRGYYVGRSSGVSVRVMKGLWYRAGSSRGQYIPGPELQTPIDQGQVIVTTARVVFKGRKTTREWRYDKLLGTDTDPADNAVLLHVANRQKVSGLLLGDGTAAFEAYLGTGLAIAEQGAEAIARALEGHASRHMVTRPRPPG